VIGFRVRFSWIAGQKFDLLGSGSQATGEPEGSKVRVSDLWIGNLAGGTVAEPSSQAKYGVD